MVTRRNFAPDGLCARKVATSFKPLDCFPPALNVVKRFDRFLPAIFSQQPFCPVGSGLFIFISSHILSAKVLHFGA
jgi:hypothetical protein